VSSRDAILVARSMTCDSRTYRSPIG
jgi:hypothetical protein